MAIRAPHILILISIKIVDKSSAVLGLPDTREKAVALNANHEAICRFANEESDEYKQVSSLIVDFLYSAMESPEDSNSSLSLVESFDSLNTTLIGDDCAGGPSFCGCLVNKRDLLQLLIIFSNDSHDTLSAQ